MDVRSLYYLAVAALFSTTPVYAANISIAQLKGLDLDAADNADVSDEVPNSAHSDLLSSMPELKDAPHDPSLIDRRPGIMGAPSESPIVADDEQSGLDYYRDSQDSMDSESINDQIHPAPEEPGIYR